MQQRQQQSPLAVPVVAAAAVGLGCVTVADSDGRPLLRTDFRCPTSLKHGDRFNEYIKQVDAKAGDVVIMTETVRISASEPHLSSRALPF